jgi:hypothetical protein
LLGIFLLENLIIFSLASIILINNKHFSILFLEANEESSTSEQTGKGAEKKKRKIDFDSESESSEFYNNLADKVAEKLKAKSTFTNLWRPSEISTPTLLTVKTPSTEPPLPFANKIEKNLEHDEFGKSILILYYRTTIYLQKDKRSH